MNIRETNEFKTLKIENTGNATPKIVIGNSKLNNSIQVLGGVLEAQYSADDSYLLFVTEGNPLEEALYIYFLDSKLRVKEILELSADYAEGIFSNPIIIEKDSIRFSFFGKEDNWILTVSENPRISFFGFKYPVKRRSSILHKSWLKLKKS